MVKNMLTVFKDVEDIHRDGLWSGCIVPVIDEVKEELAIQDTPDRRPNKI